MILSNWVCEYNLSPFHQPSRSYKERRNEVAKLCECDQCQPMGPKPCWLTGTTVPLAWPFVRGETAIPGVRTEKP